MLKYSPDFQEVRNVAERVAITPGVVRSEPFTVATVNFAADRVRVHGLLKAASVRIEHTGSLPGIIMGTGLLRRLGATAGAFVEIQPRAPAEATVAVPVGCEVVGTKRFRLTHTDDNLALASFEQLERLGLKPTGVDVWLEDVDAGRDLARILQSQLGPQYQVLSLFEIRC